MKNDLMREPEVEQETGVPRGTLAYWRHIGTGPRWAKLGRRVVYRRADVAAWVEAQFEAADARRSA